MQDEQKLKLSITETFRDKKPLRGSLPYLVGFDPYEATLEELEQVVSAGLAISFQFKDGVRKTENFIASDFLAADFDGVIDIDDGLALDIVKRYGSLFYTTASHSRDAHHFRIVFALPRTITDAKELKFASRALAQRLGSDLAATDAARLFFGCQGCRTEILGSMVTDEFLNELIEDGKLEVSSAYANNGTLTGNRSSFRIDGKTNIQFANGEILAFDDIKGKHSVYCPHHRDTRPSAFVSQNQKGDNFLHCSACSKTWWSKSTRPSDFDFFAFDHVIKKIHENPSDFAPVVEGGLTAFYDAPQVVPNKVSIQSSQYLSETAIPKSPPYEGITLIKSPKGSGKTTCLASALKSVTQNFETLEEYEEADDPSSPVPFYSKEKVLLIGHRQALIGELCQRLRLNSYLDHPEPAGVIREKSVKHRFGVCLDSIRRIGDIKYDVVVIDEVEQVLAHFLSSSIGKKREECFEIFSRVVREARHVIALDADLDWTTFNTLRLIKTKLPPRAKPPKHPDTSHPISVVLNDWKDEGRELSLYSNKSHLIEKLKLDILAGRRVFVTSNSKKLVEALTNVVKKLEKDSDRPIPYLSITSANSKSDEVQEFIKDAKTKILDYQVILSSPSLGTGVDITFPNGAQEIDVVIGLFEAGITNHFEIDQQLGRVRKPREIHVWISPRRYNFETTFEVVVDDLLQGDLIGSVHRGLEWQDRKSLADEDPFLTMAALIAARNRASHNALKSNFIEHKLKQNWTINQVAKDEVMAFDGKMLLEYGAHLSAEEHAKAVLSAPILNEIQYKEIGRRLDLEGSPVSASEVNSMRRTALELFYRQDATQDLIRLDDRTSFRGRVLRFEALSLHASNPKGFVEHQDTKIPRGLRKTAISTIPNTSAQAALLYTLLSATPVFEKGVFRADVEFSNSQLAEFLHRSLKLKQFIEGQFDLSTQRDADKKTTQHLGKILRLIGLKLERACERVENKQTVRYYKLNKRALATMQDIVGRRKSVYDWEYVNDKYGFEYTDDELRILHPQDWF